MASTFYRLVRLTRHGLAVVDRHAYTSPARADIGRFGEDVAVTCSSVLDPDVLVVDGRWHAGVDLGYPRAVRLPPAPSKPGPAIPPAALLHDTQPDDWIGRLFVDRWGAGAVWTGAGLLGVEDHRIAPPSPPRVTSACTAS